MSKVIGYFRLLRPANIVTAVTDILAGIAIASSLYNINTSSIVWLIIATIGLYGGGVVFNDVFDAELDKIERPERPIPSGVVSKAEASVLGIVALSFGITSAYVASSFSGILASTIAVAAVVYDKWGKHHPILGPVNMGLCRGLNLLLGISIVSMAVEQYWYLGLVPVVYIIAITMISRGEVHGSNRTIIYAAAFLYSIVMMSIIWVSGTRETLPLTLLCILLWGALIFPPLWKAIRNPEGKLIGKAVKAGVIALIIMDAAWAFAFDAHSLAIIIFLLLPVSILLARIFAVT